MNKLSDLHTIIKELTILSSQVNEPIDRITISGDKFNQVIFDKSVKIYEIYNEITNHHCSEDLILRVDDVNLDLSETDISLYIDTQWRIILAKQNLAKLTKARDHENTLLFFKKDSFLNWVDSIDPCSPESVFSKPTTIRILGENVRFGSELLWVLPIEEYSPKPDHLNIPNDNAIQQLIHVVSLHKTIRISPKTFTITWGTKDHELAKPFIKLGILTLSSCIVQELRCTEDNYRVTIRGLKRQELFLFSNHDIYDLNLLEKLIKTVVWVYEERSETRLKLIMDRLSIDIEKNMSLVQGLNFYLNDALKQAKDSYAFVILERKDAYHKEMRDLLKDMKSQADLYATKVRDLITSLTRDILGILIFIGLSFVGKFDTSNLSTLIDSIELATFLKFLSGYLIFSCLLQIASHYKDASLSYKESKKWLNILQNYTSKSDNNENFLNPITQRRNTLFLAMGISIFIYILLASAVWNLPSIIHYLLNPT